MLVIVTVIVNHVITANVQIVPVTIVLVQIASVKLCFSLGER